MHAINIFYKVDVPGPLLGRDPLWFDSCKRSPPVSDRSIFAFWLVAYGRFDCVFRKNCDTLIVANSRGHPQMEIKESWVLFSSFFLRALWTSHLLHICLDIPTADQMFVWLWGWAIAWYALVLKLRRPQQNAQNMCTVYLPITGNF